MCGEQGTQNGEKILPVFYKKKVLTLEKTKDLEEMMEYLKKENDQTIANEKVMLDKIRIKDNEFVKRLEDQLEFFKAANVREIILTQDMLPEWSPRKKDSSSKYSEPPELEDSLERLVAWYSAVETYVSTQREQVSEIISDWFSHLDRIASEGDADPQDIQRRSENSVEPVKSSDNTLWYIIIVLFCLAHLFVSYNPEDFEQCTDGFIACFIQNALKFRRFLFNFYLRLHNITLDHQPDDSGIDSIDVSA